MPNGEDRFRSPDNRGMACPVCSAMLQEAFQAVVLQTRSAVYDHCDHCGFLRVRSPTWLEEAYSDAIAVTDTGIVQRNLITARRLAVVLEVLGHGESRCVDVAGGYGLLTRLMRDLGYDFYWSDRYCSNLVARGFEFDRASTPYQVVTAFEVLEHVEDPSRFVRDSLAEVGADTMVFSTELYTGSPPDPAQWWYYSLDTGQHIAFYRRDTLERLASTLALNFHSVRGIHIFSRRDLPRRKLDLLAGPLMPLATARYRRRRQSKTWQDHLAMAQGLRRS